MGVPAETAARPILAATTSDVPTNWAHAGARGAGPSNESGAHRRWVQAWTPGPAEAYALRYVAGGAQRVSNARDVKWAGTSDGPLDYREVPPPSAPPKRDLHTTL